MQRLARPRATFGSRLAFGAVMYWTLNAALLFQEARWHLLYRLTLWDVAQLRAIGIALASTTHSGLPH